MVLPSREVETFLSALPGFSGASPIGPGARPIESGTVPIDRGAALDRRSLSAHGNARPFVTVTWAQTINGVVGTRDRRPLSISSQQSLELTHALRGSHHAILVGIGAVLGDDPRLTTRLWDGPDPTPVVLDSTLRTPAGAALFERDSDPPIIVYDKRWDADDTDDLTTGVAWSKDTTAAFLSQKDALQRRGARLVPGEPHNVPTLLALLHELGIGSVMVEGGVRVIRSFLGGTWVDNVVITTAPQLVDGYSLNDGETDTPRAISFIDPVYAQFGPDLVVGGAIRWE